MSDKEQQQTPIATPKTNNTVSTKSKKRAQPEQMSKMKKITEFFSDASKRQKLAGIQDGGSFDPQAPQILSNIRRPISMDPDRVILDQDLKQGRQSTATSISPQQINDENQDPRQSAEEQTTGKDEQLSQKSQSRKLKDSARKERSVDQSDTKSKRAKMSLDPSQDFEMSENRVKQNRDHCNICKDGGELLCCDNCPRSFHYKCLGVIEEEVPEGDWYCKTCIPIIEKKKQHDEEKRKKHEEKERQIEEKRRQKEEAQQARLQEFEKKREEKRLEKERQEEEKQRIKEQKLEELKLKMAKRDSQQSTLVVNGDGVNIGENRVDSPEAMVLMNGDIKTVSSGDMKKLNAIDQMEGLDKPQGKKKPVKKEDIGSTQRKVEEKSEAEKAKDAKAKEYKNQFKIFQRVYPELVDKSFIKYPIEDKLIKKMPLLHGAESFPNKPEHKKILVEGPQFERLLYVWEFFNNFSDLLKIQNFKIEELYAALSYSQKPTDSHVFSQPENEELDWEESISNKTVAETGFGLVQQLHCAALECFIGEVKAQVEKSKASAEANKDNADDDEDQLLLAAIKYFDKFDMLWPELTRIILKSKKFAFHPLEDHIRDTCDYKLSNCTPDTYPSVLTLDEKLDILETIVDGLHDLDEFRVFLNVRLEEKSSYNKQKLEIYAEIKSLESQKAELIKEHAQNNFFNNSEQIINQIDDLKKKLESANRIESKRIQQQINDLQSEKNKILKEMQKIEDQIEKRQNKIERMNEGAHKTSIKNQMIGKDADRNEYWHYKEEPGKLFIKKFEEIEVAPKVEKPSEANGDQVMEEEEAQEVAEPKFSWFYYDEEDEFEKLIEACNVKGIRERKLQENLRKIRDRLKLKKSKKPSLLSTEAKEGDAKDEEQKDVEMHEEQSQLSVEDLKYNKNKHFLFENDSYYTTLINAIWYGRKMPTKRQIMMENKSISTRRQVGQSAPTQVKDVQKPKVYDEGLKPTVDMVRSMMLSIEELYTDSSINFQREWDFKQIRDRTIQTIEKAETVEELGQQLLKLDQGFSHPHSLKYKEAKADGREDMQSSGEEQTPQKDVEMEEEKKDEYHYDKNVKVYPLKFFKYWSSKELRSAWRQYIFQECIEQNINALYIAVKILEKVNGEFLQRQFENQYKKQRKEQKQMNPSGKRERDDSKNVNSSRMGRPEKPSYKQYFESDDEEASNDKSKKNQSGRPRGRPKKEDSEVESQYYQEVEEEEIDVDEEDEDEDEREWDDKCSLCKKGGNVICCETCPHVVHLTCIGLKKNPEGDWHCEDCLVKQTQRRTTRGQVSGKSGPRTRNR